MEVKKRKSNQGKWYGSSKKAKYSLSPGLRGFLAFCNHREREAIGETKSIFDQYDTAVEEEEEENNDADDDIDAEMDKELEKLKSEAGQKKPRFQLLDSGAQNVLFFKTTNKDPVQLVTKVLEDISSTGVQKTKHLIRLVPVETTCKAYEENIKEAGKRILSRHFSEGKTDKTFSVVFKARCNQSVTKEDAIKIICGVMKDDIKSEAKVDYKCPDLAVVLEIIKGQCCMAVLPDYFKYKKYNLIEIVSKNKEDS